MEKQLILISFQDEAKDVIRLECPDHPKSALDPSVPFRSAANREAIRAALAQLKAGRHFGP
jgi:hypothetical protein